jgi:NADH:ubiquinone oxidoreductase subunit E
MKKVQICICLGSSCFARGNEKNLQVIEDFMEKYNLQDGVDLDFGCCLCQGACASGPNVTIDGKMYGNVDPGMMLELLRKYFPEAK